jgi:hypothetical protein
VGAADFFFSCKKTFHVEILRNFSKRVRAQEIFKMLLFGWRGRENDIPPAAPVPLVIDAYGLGWREMRNRKGGYGNEQHRVIKERISYWKQVVWMVLSH